MERGSNLIGDNEEVKYSTESYNGNKSVYVTPSKIVTEKANSSRGRAIMLSKISMIKKSGLSGPDPFGHFIGFVLFGVSAAFFGFITLVNLDELLASSPSAGVLLVTVLSILSVLALVKTIVSYKTKDWSSPDGVVWFNARGTEGGVGFKIKEDNIRPIMDAMEEGMIQDVRVIEDN